MWPWPVDTVDRCAWSCSGAPHGSLHWLQWHYQEVGTRGSLSGAWYDTAPAPLDTAGHLITGFIIFMRSKWMIKSAQTEAAARWHPIKSSARWCLKTLLTQLSLHLCVVMKSCFNSINITTTSVTQAHSSYTLYCFLKCLNSATRVIAPKVKSFLGKKIIKKGKILLHSHIEVN